MRFAEFIKKMPLQNDDAVNAFLIWSKTQTDFPSSSHPIELSNFFYKKLNGLMTLGFRKCFIIYTSLPNCEVPKYLLEDKHKLNDAVDHIIELQNADKNLNKF